MFSAVYTPFDTNPGLVIGIDIVQHLFVISTVESQFHSDAPYSLWPSNGIDMLPDCIKALPEQMMISLWDSETLDLYR